MRALLTLLAKELRALFPLGVLGFALISGDLISRPVTERIDENTYDHVAGIAPGEGGFLAFIFWILAFFVAYAAFPREHDEKTIEMLYALPVRRSGIFFTKVLAGLVTLTGVAFMGQCTNYVLQALNPNSIDGDQFQLALVLRVAMLHATVACFLYFHGLFASIFRMFGVLPYTLLWFALLLVQELVPSLAWLNPAAIVSFEYSGDTLLVPWWPIAFHGGLALFVALLAYLGWMGPVDRLRETFAGRSTLAIVSFGGGSFLVLACGFGMMIYWVMATYSNRPPPADPSAPTPVTEREFATSEARSEHYAFVYPGGLEEPVLRLLGHADAVLDSEVVLLGASAAPHITVDLAEESGHHEGIAAGTRIRMGASGQPDWRLLHVLAHESAHVLQNEVSGRYLMDHGQTTRFLIEGGAEWVAFETLTRAPGVSDVAPAITSITDQDRREDEELRRYSRIVATLAWERRRIRVEDTFDDASFRARWDTTLAYPYGETFAEAIARACGDQTVGRAFATFGREGAPQSAAGEALYRDALGSIGCDYEAVLAAHDALMTETAAQERAFLDTVPELSGGVVGLEGTDVVIEATLDRAPLASELYVVRVRNDAGAPDTEVRGFHGEIVDGSSPRRVRFHVPRLAITGARFDFLFSLDVDPRAFPHSAEWQSAPAP
ncbi:MAG: ABC transporter permease [Sandaracinaceae bacterium]|nr:ABC transporter permease [Sandaracinaceae bacterium]